MNDYILHPSVTGAPTLPTLIPLTYWSTGPLSGGAIHQIRRLMYVHLPKRAIPAQGHRTICGQLITDLQRARYGEARFCKVCEAGAINEIGLIYSGLGTRWRLSEPVEGLELSARMWERKRLQDH